MLFITPPALAALAARLTDRQREAIHGIHYGGMSLTPETVNDFRAAFPNAVHLAGYGNTLFGVVMEVADGPRQALDYFPARRPRAVSRRGRRHETSARLAAGRCSRGERGRVLFHRLDESCLLVGVVERDEAERIAASRRRSPCAGRHARTACATRGRRLALGRPACSSGLY